MARGGARPGAGRKPGQTTKLNEKARAKALEGGISPLDYMLCILRDEQNPEAVRFEAAKAAAPYVHAKLAAIEHSGGLALSHEDALNELDDGSGEDATASTEE